MTKDLKQQQRERYLANLIKEGILNVLVEQDFQQQQTSAVPPSPVTPSLETNVPDPAANPQQPQQPGQEEFTVDEMVKKLNILRGGKSFTDPEVYGKITTFFKGLTDEQKTSFEWLLNELTKIVVDMPETEPQAPQTPQTQQRTQAPGPGAGMPSGGSQGAPLTATGGAGQPGM